MATSSGGLTAEHLTAEWRRMGITGGTAVIVHSSLSGLGHVEGGAEAVVASLRAAVGPGGTLVAPAFTTQVTDPAPERLGAPDADTRRRRAAAPDFHAELESSVGAVPEAVRALPDSLRSRHPQASVVAVGAEAATVVEEQSLGFATGPRSPFGRLHELDGHILLIGVGHNRNTFLHHAESLTPHPRLKVRRFPWHVDGERVWLETLDVADDNDTHFPTVGREFEQQTGIAETTVGNAACRLVPVRPFVAFARRRLTELLAADSATTSDSTATADPTA